MIARLRGLLVEIDADEAVIDVGGVGYLVRCASRTLARLGPPGGEITLFVESQFSAEAGPRLYGFQSREDRQCFRLLQSVQGVGPKAALAVLDVLPPADLARAVSQDDKALVGRAVGVGPKLAQRIVVELKGKALGFSPLDAPVPPPPPPAPSLAGEAVLALMGLGVPEPQARRAVERAAGRDGGADLPALIRAALQEVSG